MVKIIEMLNCEYSTIGQIVNVIEMLNCENGTSGRIVKMIKILNFIYFMYTNFNALFSRSFYY